MKFTLIKIFCYSFDFAFLTKIKKKIFIYKKYITLITHIQIFKNINKTNKPHLIHAILSHTHFIQPLLRAVSAQKANVMPST
ncbi:hypothetical protein [Enterobacter hormaechei]|nr:hypothetical protein [Enterobacter hormaechei]